MGYARVCMCVCCVSVRVHSLTLCVCVRPDPSKVVDLARAALHQCVLPRALLSLPDAVYAARFALLTHALGTHKFSSLAFLDKAFEDVAATVFSCTSSEAQCYGTGQTERGSPRETERDGRGYTHRKAGCHDGTRTNHVDTRMDRRKGLDTTAHAPPVRQSARPLATAPTSLRECRGH
jgi:hypothetical protein